MGNYRNYTVEPTLICNSWTDGYISEWNTKYPGWTDGYISEWKPSPAPPYGKKLSCQGCAIHNLAPITRYINGTTDGTEAALSDIQRGTEFNPACDPTGSHASDLQHTTEYCNGWTNGYISAWNYEHSPSQKRLTIPTNGKGLAVLSLICKTMPIGSYNCRYVNGTFSQLSIK
jgi:hypothetical protein